MRRAILLLALAFGLAGAGPTPSLPYVHTLDPAFGMVGDGVTDDTAAVQNWANACSTSPNVCIVDDPPNFYQLRSAISFTGAAPAIHGPAIYRGKFQQINCSADGFDIIPSSGRPMLHNFSIDGCGSATSGRLLYITHTSGYVVREVALDYGYNAIRLDGVYQNVGGFGSFLIDRIDASACISDCITASNTGDSKIVDSILDGVGPYVIHEIGYCGLSIDHNKITGGTAVPVYLDSPTDGDCAVRNNSIEGWRGAGIQLYMGTSPTVGNLQIQDNQIGGYGIPISIGGPADTGGPQEVQITGNILSCGAAPGSTGLVHYVGNNSLLDADSVVSCYQGLYIGPYSNHVRVGVMSFDPASVTVPVWNGGADTKFIGLQGSSPY
jgi:hypothetical protein